MIEILMIPRRDVINISVRSIYVLILNVLESLTFCFIWGTVLLGLKGLWWELDNFNYLHQKYFFMKYLCAYFKCLIWIKKKSNLK